MNLVDVNERELMDVEGGTIGKQFTDGGRASNAVLRSTSTFRSTPEADRAAVSFLVHVGVGAATAGPKGAIGGAALFLVRNW